MGAVQCFFGTKPVAGNCIASSDCQLVAQTPPSPVTSWRKHSEPLRGRVVSAAPIFHMTYHVVKAYRRIAFGLVWNQFSAPELFWGHASTSHHGSDFPH